MTLKPDALCRQLGYRFNDAGLLADALTHRSAGSRNNERLEFLGDAILNFVIADALFHHYDTSSEGDLSRLRANLVNRDALAVHARHLKLGEYLTLGSGELKSGGFRRDSILADALEAVFGAVYLDGGFEVCRQLIMGLYRNMLTGLPDAEDLKDPKTRLQEYLQSRKAPLPEYEVIDVSGEAHAQVFVVDCRVSGIDAPVQGRGGSRRKAEQDAAARALEQLSGESGA